MDSFLLPVSKLFQKSLVCFSGCFMLQGKNSSIILLSVPEIQEPVSLWQSKSGHVPSFLSGWGEPLTTSLPKFIIMKAAKVL